MDSLRGDDVLFEFCEEDGSGRMRINQRRFACAVLGDEIAAAGFACLPEMFGEGSDAWFATNVPTLIDNWILFHQRCIQHNKTGPHAEAIAAYRAFRTSERCARFVLFLRKTRLLSLREDRDAAVRAVKEYETYYPDTVIALDGPAVVAPVAVKSPPPPVAPVRTRGRPRSRSGTRRAYSPPHSPYQRAQPW